MKVQILTLCAASLLTAGLAQPAFAEDREIIVQYQAYELAHPDGRAAVEARIERAAKQVCSLDGLRGVAARLESQACFDATYSEAINRLTSWSEDISSEKTATPFLYSTAAFRANESTNAVLPIPGRAAITTMSEG